MPPLLTPSSFSQVVVKKLEEKLILKMVVPLLVKLSQDSEM